MNILFTYLVGFSGNGGIERFNRCFIRACNEICEAKNNNFHAVSVYDSKTNPEYLHESKFTGYNKSKLRYILLSFLQSFSFDTIIIGHVNLAILGLLIKCFLPNKKVILIAHGIEIWHIKIGYKIHFLKKVNQIFCVSNYTKMVIERKYKLDSGKISVLHNTLDPGFSFPKSFQKPTYLLDRYKLSNEVPIVLTITRMSHHEKYKGYDLVLEAISSIVKTQQVKYVLGGKYTHQEKLRLDMMIDFLGLNDYIIFPGYIPESELIDYYLLGDVFVMPSKKEGFGIVFIEALACGLNVIGGNKDGTVDALLNGTLGTLINPDNVSEIESALSKNISLKKSEVDKLQTQQKLIETFGFNTYKHKLETLIFT
ncbi:MAG: glycosyltransferase family 4 protein [Bacteroidota bacterium]|nr:glycosyltransferase family 4 protein [Bacteroidota bacterium]